MVKRFVIPAACIAVLLSMFIGPKAVRYVENQREIRDQARVVLPPADLPIRSSQLANISSSHSPSSSAVALRTAANWNVPFTPQAPLANWDALHEEACEEASVLMVLQYFQGKGPLTPQAAEDAIQALVAKNEALGFPVDDTAEQMKALLLAEDASLSVHLLPNPAVSDIKQALSEGKLVIVPAAGRLLRNPYYTPPGPLYHALVLRGYTADDRYVITNDPGTRRGEQYAYTWERLMNAIHDWNGGDVERGEKVVLVIGKNE